MLVDLGRNDVGRVSQYGTVTVSPFMKVERYSHVMHIVSQVTGELEAHHSSYDVMKACFPAGTVSGAPKVRAMQIIEELEPTTRGPYAGAVFFVQAVVSQRWHTKIRTPPFEIYRALRVLNPSPYMYYLRVGGMELVGSSPEVLVRCEDQKIVVRPIAGTRPRGKTPLED